MARAFYLAIEVLLLATVPAVYFFDVQNIALVARLLCVMLFAAAFWRATHDDRYFVFGLLLAFISGGLWSTEVFGVMLAPMLWATYLLFAYEIVTRVRGRFSGWELRFPIQRFFA